MPEGLERFSVSEGESDLDIAARTDLSREARRELVRQRAILAAYLHKHPNFHRALHPLPAEPDAPEIVRVMSTASFMTRTGPMAAVAGAIAEMVGGHILSFSEEVIVENGGDIFLKMSRPATIGLYAGDSPFSLRLGISVAPSRNPKGIATSSGTVGHSFSRGKADLVTIISSSASLSDGAATYFANHVSHPGDFSACESMLPDFPFIEGIVIITGKELFSWGQVQLVSLPSS